MKLHNPLPEDLETTCKKSASILEHFIKGHNELDGKLIPQVVLKNACGIAILTIVKAGVLWSGRAGTGLIVARLPDGSWSAPSMICAAGVGVGAQFGIQQTDVVFVLNTSSAVKAFSHGNLTLGGNISVAAGPTGRSSEAGGALIHAAPIYSYSKSKGVFVGVTLEGTLILTRKKTNARFYGPNVTALDIISGKIPPPAQAEPFYRMLNIKFGHLGHGAIRKTSSTGSLNADPRLEDSHKNTHDLADNSTETLDQLPSSSFSSANIARSSTFSYPTTHINLNTPPPAYTSTTLPLSPKKTVPPLPVKPKPIIGSKPKKCVTLFKYSSTVEGDLCFEKGQVIWITKEMGEWTEGTLNGKKGIFPTSYVSISSS